MRRRQPRSVDSLPLKVLASTSTVATTRTTATDLFREILFSTGPRTTIQFLLHRQGFLYTICLFPMGHPLHPSLRSRPMRRSSLYVTDPTLARYGFAKPVPGFVITGKSHLSLAKVAIDFDELSLIVSWQDNLALVDNPASSGLQHPMQPPPPYSTSAGPALRPENGPQGISGRRGPPVHRPTRSQEDEQRSRSGVKQRGPPRELDIFADPAETVRHRENRRPTRRNSESSVADRAGKPLDPEEEKRRRERRHRERDAGARDGKGRSHTSSKPKKPNQRLDVIDKLDVTSIYGMGRK